jgi:hypothetical protein
MHELAGIRHCERSEAIQRFRCKAAWRSIAAGLDGFAALAMTAAGQDAPPRQLAI